MFASIPPTATTKIAVPMTLICGGSATRAAPHTNKGNVVVEPALKYVITKSSTESAKASRAAEMIPGARHLQSARVADDLPQRGQVRPVAVAEAAVPPARPRPARLRLEDDDAR